jgi:hypothetical protein
MLIGVSRAYKESSNCRMEAQYGLQRQKQMIPLMMQEGYEADGWLGMLVGTSLWYALYGATLASEAAFEDRMSALAREIGSRGRADAAAAEPYAAAPLLEMDESEAAAAARPPASEGCPLYRGGGDEASTSADDAKVSMDPAEADLRPELQQPRLAELRQRALTAGVDGGLVDDALDAQDARAALVALVAKQSGRLRAELEALRTKDLRRRAKADGASPAQLEAAADADEPRAAAVELVLLLRAALLRQ